MAALLLAVRDRLRAAPGGATPGLGYAEAEAEVGWDGMPHPKAGQVFAAVHPGSVTQGLDTCMSESYAVGVTLSMRLGQLPIDRWGAGNVALASTGLYARAEAIRALLHMNEVVRAAANATIGVADNGFTETIRYLSMDPPVPRGPEWWHAEDDANPPVGLSLTVNLGDARRYQVIEEQS